MYLGYKFEGCFSLIILIAKEGNQFDAYLSGYFDFVSYPTILLIRDSNIACMLILIKYARKKINSRIFFIIIRNI
jgi:hypothetical protein